MNEAGWRYLRAPSKFLFDLVTSVPFSYYDLIIYEARRDPTGVMSYQDSLQNMHSES